MFNNFLGNGLSGIGNSGILVTCFLIYLTVVGGIGIVIYILRAIGIYKMSITAEIHNPWIAFIPVINCFTFGTLAEKYKKRDGTPSAKFGIILLILQISSFVISVITTVFAVKSAIEIIANADKAIDSHGDMTLEMFSSLVPVMVLGVVMIGVLIAFSVVRYVALWRIFSSFDYQNATLFTVLSIFFNFLEPIFLFILRNNKTTFDYSQRMGIYSQY